MTRPAFEMADIVRRKGRQFLQRFKAILSYQQLKAYRAIQRCRTAALGGHKDKCEDCPYEAPISYNSCRSRSCPKCQAQARKRWLEAQRQDLLNTNYFHVVFTVPHELNPLALTSRRPFSTCYSTPAPRPCSKSLEIPDASLQRSGSSPSCTRGVPTCCPIIMSIASFPVADYRPIISAGSTPAIRCSCCLFPSCAPSSARNSSPASASSIARACST